MPRISKRLHGPAQVSNAAATKYTVPTATLAIIRHMHISNPTAAIVALTLSIGNDAAATRIFDAFSIPAGQTYDHYCYYSLVAAEVIQGFASVNNVLTLTINGEESVLG